MNHTHSIRFSLPFEVNECSRLSDQDLEGAVRVLESEDEVDPREVAIVKFTPSAVNPNAQYADEIYYPPVDDQINPSRNIIIPPNAVDSKYATISVLCFVANFRRD